jgi:hypothetical protein
MTVKGRGAVVCAVLLSPDNCSRYLLFIIYGPVLVILSTGNGGVICATLRVGGLRKRRR